MKHLTIAISGLALAACGGSGPSAEKVCNAMIDGDAEAAKEIMGDGVQPDAMCACVGKTVDAMPDAQKEAHLGVMKAVTAIRKDKGVGVEEAAEALEEVLRSTDNPHGFSENDFEQTGRMLNRVGNQLEDGGSCKAG